MTTSLLLLIIFILTMTGYVIGRTRASRMRNNPDHAQHPHSLPRYYGYMVAIWTALPALIVIILWTLFESGTLTRLITSDLPQETRSLPQGELNLVINDIKNLAVGNISQSTDDPVRVAAAEQFRSLLVKSQWTKNILAILAGLVGMFLGLRSVQKDRRARVFVERAIMVLLIGCSSLAILTTVGIVLSVLFESLRFFDKVPFSDFAFGLHWSPQTAIRADQVGSSGSFGAVPIFAGTLLISAIAMLVAVPFGLMSAIYLA